MKSKENIEKKGLRRLSDEELKEVTGGAGATATGEIPPCLKRCPNPRQHRDLETCECVDY